ncbi:MAG TPA: branched-chain amino acid ABC transporter permease [Acetobacteraceae bacterium]|nr:branched-chain amino acid ABC transporter permease [Acetobacteraceae bacterium]
MFAQFISATIDGLTSGATLFLVAVGLSLVFGVLKILNVAHGSFYAIGAFMAALVWTLLGAAGLPRLLIYPALVLTAIAVGVVLGPFVERVLLHWSFEIEPLSRRENIQLLATYAVFLMLEDGQKLVFGTQPYYSGGALGLLGSTRIRGIFHTNYQLLLIPVAAITLVLLRLFLARTRTGRCLVAVAEDAETAATMGVRVARMQTLTFTLGAALAALGGALASSATGVSIGIGADITVLSFAVVATAGLGQIEGTAVAAILIGVAHSWAVFFLPVLDTIAPYLIMLLVLLVRPIGLFGTDRRRRI